MGPRVISDGKFKADGKGDRQEQACWLPNSQPTVTNHRPFHACKGCPGQSLGVQNKGDCQNRDVPQAVQLHKYTTDNQHSRKKVEGTALGSNFYFSLCSMSQYPNSRDSAGQDSAVAQKCDSTLGFLPEPRPSEASRGLRLRHKNDTRRTTYRTGSGGNGHQIHRHGWLRADNGILDQILYSGQICSPFILLSANQEEMQESHKKKRTRLQLHLLLEPLIRYTVILPVITSQILFPYPILALLSA